MLILFSEIPKETTRDFGDPKPSTMLLQEYYISQISTKINPIFLTEKVLDLNIKHSSRVVRYKSYLPTIFKQLCLRNNVNRFSNYLIETLWIYLWIYPSFSYSLNNSKNLPLFTINSTIILLRLLEHHRSSYKKWFLMNMTPSAPFVSFFFFFCKTITRLTNLQQTITK